MSAKHPVMRFKTKEQLLSAKEDYERMGFTVKANLADLTATVYQNLSTSKKHREREAKLAAKRETEEIENY